MTKLVDNILKLAACDTPGAKIRSKGKGKGLGSGDGKGPLGIPVGEKAKDIPVKKEIIGEEPEAVEKKAEAFLAGYLYKN